MDPRFRLVFLLAALNVATFAMYGLDKHRAKTGGERIPEALLLWGAAFGPIGALLGMYAFHHKTRKPRFRYGVPALLLLELALLLFLAHPILSLNA